jgi:hypothetical protein
MSTESIAKRLIELCRQGQGDQAQQELYAEDVISVEMDGLPNGAPSRVEGMPAVREKSKQFRADIVEVHGRTVSDPVVVGTWFALTMTMDVTFRERGRVNLEEVCVYRVRGDKIVQEQFFYDMG